MDLDKLNLLFTELLEPKEKKKSLVKPEPRLFLRWWEEI